MKLRTLLAVASVVGLGACVFGKSGDPDCTYYCDRMEENCDKRETSFLNEPGNADSGFDFDACMATCAEYRRDPEPGTSLGEPVPNSNSLECRAYHVNNAAGERNGDHCDHASEGGGGVCTDFQEVCDTLCVGAREDGFDGIVEFCAGQDDGFASTDECAEYCNSLPVGDEGDTVGETRHCLLTVALEAFEESDVGLCSEAGPDSTVCVSE